MLHQQQQTEKDNCVHIYMYFFCKINRNRTNGSPDSVIIITCSMPYLRQQVYKCRS